MDQVSIISTASCDLQAVKSEIVVVDSEIAPPAGADLSSAERSDVETAGSIFSLEGLNCVVTGGASGMGFEIVQGLVAQGANVAIVDLDFQKAAQKANELTERQSRRRPATKAHPPAQRITAHKVDVASESSIDLAVKDIVQQHDHIDRLVTSAGICENYDAVTYPTDRMHKLWSINVDGTYLFAVAVARHLIGLRKPGSIVFIGSMSGSVVNVPQRQTPYHVSKAAVRHMAASLAVEWAEAGIRVNCVSPGYMLTPLTQRIIDNDPELYQEWISRIPQKRMGQPREVVGAVTYLLSDASSYVTGADLRLDGGYSII